MWHVAEKERRSGNYTLKKSVATFTYSQILRKYLRINDLMAITYLDIWRCYAYNCSDMHIRTSMAQPFDEKSFPLNFYDRFLLKLTLFNSRHIRFVVIALLWAFRLTQSDTATI
jgi:hypothetical protein